MHRFARFLILLAAFTAASLHAQSARPPGGVPPPPRDRVVICVDRSESMGPAAVESIRDAIARTVGTGAEDLPFDVALVAFAMRSTQLSGLGHRPAAIATVLPQLALERDRRGGTHLYDAIAGAAAELRTPGGGRKRVLVVSDGNDEGSVLALPVLLARLGGDIAVDAIGFGRGATSASGSLATLAGATGGRFVAAASTSDLYAAMVALLKPLAGSGGVGSATAVPATPVPPPAPPAPPAVVSAPPAPPAMASPGGATAPAASGPALHTVKVSVHAGTDTKCLQLAYGVALESLQDVSATMVLVSGRLGAVNLSINCVAVGGGQPAVALVTAAGGTALAAAQAGDSIAAKLAAATP